LGKNQYRLIRTPVMAKVSEEYDDEKAVPDTAVRIARTWTTAVINSDFKPWVEDNYEVFKPVWWASIEAVQLIGAGFTADIVEDTLEAYGREYPADFLESGGVNGMVVRPTINISQLGPE